MINVKEILVKYQRKEKESPTIFHYTDYNNLQFPQIDKVDDLELETIPWDTFNDDEIFKLIREYGFSKRLSINNESYELRLEGNHLLRINLDVNNSKIYAKTKGFAALYFDGKMNNSSMYFEPEGIGLIVFSPEIIGNSSFIFNLTNSKISVIKFISFIKNANVNLKSRAIARNAHIDFSFDPEIIDSKVKADLRGIDYSGKLIMRGNPKLLDNSYCDFSVSGIDFGGELYGIPELTLQSSSSFGKHSLDIRKLSKESVDYLRSRGFNTMDAQNFLLDAFIFDFLSK